MAELRRLLGVLHDDDGPGGHRTAAGPRPACPALIDRVRAAGLPVDLVTTGEPRPLPDGIDVSAYRIVQEALTNVVRHAGSAPTTVRIGWSPTAVELDVCDDGDGDVVSATPPDDAGGDSAGASAGASATTATTEGGGSSASGSGSPCSAASCSSDAVPPAATGSSARLPLPAEAGA